MIRSVCSKVTTLARDERGLSTVEYVVLLVLIVAVAVCAWSQFGSRVQGKLGQASGSFDTTVQVPGAVGAVGTGPGGGGGTSGGAPAAGVGQAVAE